MKHYHAKPSAQLSKHLQDGSVHCVPVVGLEGFIDEGVLK